MSETDSKFIGWDLRGRQTPISRPPREGRLWSAIPRMHKTTQTIYYLTGTTHTRPRLNNTSGLIQAEYTKQKLCQVTFWTRELLIFYLPQHQWAHHKWVEDSDKTQDCSRVEAIKTGNVSCSKKSWQQEEYLNYVKENNWRISKTLSRNNIDAPLLV